MDPSMNNFETPSARHHTVPTKIVITVLLPRRRLMKEPMQEAIKACSLRTVLEIVVLVLLTDACGPPAGTTARRELEGTRGREEATAAPDAHVLAEFVLVLLTDACGPPAGT